MMQLAASILWRDVLPVTHLTVEDMEAYEQGLSRLSALKRRLKKQRPLSNLDYAQLHWGATCGLLIAMVLIYYLEAVIPGLRQFFIPLLLIPALGVTCLAILRTIPLVSGAVESASYIGWRKEQKAAQAEIDSLLKYWEKIYPLSNQFEFQLHFLRTHCDQTASWSRRL
jgi:hypothetical protein